MPSEVSTAETSFRAKMLASEPAPTISSNSSVAVCKAVSARVRAAASRGGRAGDAFLRPLLRLGLLARAQAVVAGLGRGVRDEVEDGARPGRVGPQLLEGNRSFVLDELEKKS
jgi:hypothetical protein